ncbi:glutamate--cysteine ligase [Halomicroarcula sp. F13]|uniref:Glutamate--cysteine ligase n=1 Tax=Haloarcula rubra TaxID=2487747 RepID=A0AAW4PMP3_9EURY|nr:glutamate-cysteine ligase family protein [Halomicroarcula rubra]MBX0321703.1 glutamate--cysteine ligase [Halomicroarcula rubra]
MSSREPIRRSIEVEYWVIDEEGRLVDPDGLVDATPGAEREFVRPMLEVKTTPCETTGELRTELFRRVRRVLRRADELDKHLVPLATPLHASAVRELPSDRTRIQNAVVGDDFEYVRHCAGTHVHVEQIPGRTVDQLNTLIALDPALALVNSARHFRGSPVANGARSELYRRMAYDSLPNQGTLWPYVENTAEYRVRLRRCYDAFLHSSLDTDFDRDTVESAFDPESAVWTPVQLRNEFSTVEWRSPDTAVPSQVVRLADDVVSVVERLRDVDLQIRDEPTDDAVGLGDDVVTLPAFETVTEHVDAAISHGLDSASLRSYLDTFGFDLSGYDPVSATLDAETISVAAARDLRLEHAERLERDIQRSSPAHRLSDGF